MEQLKKLMQKVGNHNRGIKSLCDISTYLSKNPSAVVRLGANQNYISIDLTREESEMVDSLIHTIVARRNNTMSKDVSTLNALEGLAECK